MARILVAHVHVPFVVGGAEILVNKLIVELKQSGHEAEVFSVPMLSAEPKQVIRQVDFWSSLNPSNADLVISTKFPSYFISHPNNVCWLVHQHRQCYDLLGSSFGGLGGDEYDEAFRRIIKERDKEAFESLNGLYTISSNVTKRLQTYLDVQSTVLEPPLPLGDHYYSDVAENYILSVGRLCNIKRTHLLLEAAPHVRADVKFKIVGKADQPETEEHYRSLIEKHHLENRVELLGRVSDEELLELYAKSKAVFYGPFDEDYGFVTLEAHRSGKPVVTFRDSGGVLDFVKHEQNGLVSESTPTELAKSINRVFEEDELYSEMCGRCEVKLTSWGDVVEELVR